MKQLNLIEMVGSLTEGQLLQRSINGVLTASSVESVKVKFPVGRGDGLGFSVSFLGDEASLAGVTFSLAINGKEVNIDEPALAYAVDTKTNASTKGSSRITKTMILIPEGAILQISTRSGVFTGIGVTIIVDAYLTNFFLPYDPKVNLVQYFEHQAAPGIFSDFDDILPAARGRIVGVSLFCNNVLGDFSTNDLKATLEVNGVSILEDYIPQKYIFSQNSQYINNWVVNIGGGSTFRSTIDSGNVNQLNLGYFFYFSEELESKKGRGIYKKTQDLKSESVG